MNRRGFALVTVLWVVAALGALSAAGLVNLRIGSKTSGNRLYLTRATWAREACVEILLARWASDSTARSVGTVDLGRGSWCAVRLHDPGAKLNLNTTGRAGLIALLAQRIADSSAAATDIPVRTQSMVDAILDWRDADDVPAARGAEAEWYRAHRRRPPRNGPFAHVRELAYVRGFDAATVNAVEPFLTVRGDGRVNVSVAPARVLGALTMLPPGAAALLADARRAGRAFTSHDELAEFLAVVDREVGFDEYRELVRGVTFEPTRFVGFAVGGVRGTNLTSTVILTLAPVDGYLAVIRREAE